MKVGNALATIFADVGDEPVTLGDPLVLGNLLAGFDEGGEQGAIFCIEGVEVFDMGFRDDENMNRGLGGGIFEGGDEVVFINHIGGDVAIGNFTEDAVSHGLLLENDGQ